MGIEHVVARHYRSPGLLARIENGLSRMGKAREGVGLDDLAPVDEFHVRGPLATAELIGLLGVTPDMLVLDAGCGLGGPARRLARTTGCKVTGIDLSEDYCSVGATLNRWTGLDRQVSFVVGDATDLSRFQADSFDAAWTIHAAMNIAGKSGFYGEIARALKPGARFVIYDILATRLRDLHFPVPWAMDGSASFLSTADELRAALGAAGFEKIELRDRTSDCCEFLEQGLKRLAAQEPPPLGLHLLFGPKFRDMLANLARNFLSGRVAAAVVTCNKAA